MEAVYPTTPRPCHRPRTRWYRDLSHESASVLAPRRQRARRPQGASAPGVRPSRTNTCRLSCAFQLISLVSNEADERSQMACRETPLHRAGGGHFVRTCLDGAPAAEAWCVRHQATGDASCFTRSWLSGQGGSQSMRHSYSLAMKQRSQVWTRGQAFAPTPHGATTVRVKTLAAGRIVGFTSASCLIHSVEIPPPPRLSFSCSTLASARM